MFQWLKQHQLRCPFYFHFARFYIFRVRQFHFFPRAFFSKFSVVYATRSIVCLFVLCFQFDIYAPLFLCVCARCSVLGARDSCIIFYRWFTIRYSISFWISTFNSKSIVGIMGKKYVTWHVTVTKSIYIVLTIDSIASHSMRFWNEYLRFTFIRNNIRTAAEAVRDHLHSAPSLRCQFSISVMEFLRLLF